MRHVWNAGRCCGTASRMNVDDVSYIKGLIAEMRRRYGVREMYVAGFSNGGMMAYRLACEIPEELRAIVVMSGALVYDGCDFERARNVEIYHLHGMEDDVVPLKGGTGERSLTRTSYPPLLRSIKRFAEPRTCH